jgi:hypothetical protein
MLLVVVMFALFVDILSSVRIQLRKIVGSG